MAFQTLQGQPIQIDLVVNAKTTGWSISGANAVHDSCNSGEIELLGQTFITGRTYNLTYFIDRVSNGYVQPLLGSAQGVKQTTAGFKQDTITATGNLPKMRFFSDANASIRFFSIEDTFVDKGLRQKNSIIFSNLYKKWMSYLTYVPDCGTSMFTNTYSCKGGQYYSHQHGSSNRNNFGGVQYKTIINIPFNQTPAMIKSFKSMSVQSNQLLIVGEDGITTSLGQVSELLEQDWVMDTLTDGAVSVDVFTKEGVYAASFLRDANEDLINGAPLKGNYTTIELQTTDDGDPLQLFTVQVVTTASKIGSR